MDFPQPDKDLLPDLFDYLDEQVEIAENTLREHFTIEDRDGHEVIVFDDASKEDYLEALYEDSEVMVTFFMKLTGLTRRVFASREGIDHIDLMKDWSQKDLRETEKGHTFAEACHDLMSSEMYLETALYTFYKFGEVDNRRSFKRTFESVVLDHLRDEGYAAAKDETIEGKPDIAVPVTGPPYEVLGEVRWADIDDFQKRGKNFRDEATAARENFPEAKFVAVAKLPQHQLDRRREELRDGLEEGNIDLVVFHDEIDLLFEKMEEWGVQKQPQQTTLAEQTSDE